MMATYTGSEAITVTLVSSQVDTITLTGAGTELRISQTSTTPIYIITAQPGQTPATPTVGGAGTTAIMTDYPVVLPWTGSGIVIKVISAGTGTVNFTLTNSKFAPLGDLALKADLISPTFAGIPAAPTATAGTSTTQLATTEFVTTSFPRGVMAVGNQPTVQNSISGITEIVSSGTFTAVANRYYRITFTSYNNFKQTTATVQWRIQKTNTSGTVLTLTKRTIGDFTQNGVTVVWVGTLTAGAQNVIGSISADAGVIASEPNASQPSQIIVEDIGPSV
jgi:hypothetical protein